MRIKFDHVGILISDVRCGVASLQPHDWPYSEIETFSSEGTKEVYIGPQSASGRLLLIEPIGEGPYREALVKRGPGLHHIAINVDDAIEFAEHISGSGWYLHPQTLITFAKHETLWLARPGVPLLVEVVQSKSMDALERVEFVSKIEVPLPRNKPFLTSALGLDQFQPSSEPNVFITIGGVRRRLADLVELDGSVH